MKRIKLMEETTPSLYEVGYLARGEEGAGILMGHLKRLGAEILFEGEVKSIKLSYPVRHHSSAHFGYTHFKINPDLISGLSNALKLDSEIIRFLIITPPFLKDRNQVPESVPMQPRRVVKPKTEVSEGGAVSNDLLEEKLEEILNK